MSSYEGRGNTSELWGCMCPQCGSPVGGVNREVHERLVTAAEQRGSKTLDAIVERLEQGTSTRARRKLSATAKRRIAPC